MTILPLLLLQLCGCYASFGPFDGHGLSRDSYDCLKVVETHHSVVTFLAADLSTIDTDSRTANDGRLTQHLCTRHVGGYYAVDW